LLVQRPFYAEGPEHAHVVLLHPPGGIVQGDRLNVDLEVEPGAGALITTTGATRFYRNESTPSRLEQRMTVGDGAVLEWLPQETIVYEGARAEARTMVQLAPEGRFLGWEILCLGRPEADEGFERGSVMQAFELWRHGRPLLWERGRYEGGGEILQAGWGLKGQPVLAVMAAAGPEPLAAEPVREALAGFDVEGRAAVSSLRGVLVARFLGSRAEAARIWLTAVWAAVRPLLAGRPACPPRIWSM
jgi:urease accessory protein